MVFKNRQEAGELLAHKLIKYKQNGTIVYAIPRGGVIPAVEIAKFLNAPCDLVITRKIGHPYNSEYAVAAIAENGHILKDKHEMKNIDAVWFKKAVAEQQQEIKRRRDTYLPTKPTNIINNVAILVDDGIATGLTMRVAIKELRVRNPKKIVVAAPIIPQETFLTLMREADEVVALDVPSDESFLGSVGAYYAQFPPVTDEEVITTLTT